MYDWLDDYEIFSDTDSVKEIVAKAIEDIREQFSAEVKQNLNEAAEAKDRLQDLNDEIQEKSYRIQELENKLREMTEKAENADKYDIPRKYIKKFTEDATGGFAPGDTIYCVGSECVSKDCPTCHGEKNISAIINDKETKIPCPVCRGYGKKCDIRYYVEQRTIERIDLKLCFCPNSVNYWNTESIRLFGIDGHVSKEYVFGSMQEAQAKADQLNAKQEAHGE